MFNDSGFSYVSDSSRIFHDSGFSSVSSSLIERKDPITDRITEIFESLQCELDEGMLRNLEKTLDQIF